MLIVALFFTLTTVAVIVMLIKVFYLLRKFAILFAFFIILPCLYHSCLGELKPFSFVTLCK